MTDEELLTKYLQTKDESLFTLLYQQAYNGLCALAKGVVGSYEDAEDVVQDVFHRLLESEPRPVSAGPVNSSFLLKLVQNRAIDLMRWERPPKGTVSLSALDLYQPAGDVEAPDERLQREETSRIVEAALNQLPSSKQREALKIHYGQGMTIAETAELLAIEEDAAETLIRRGRKELRKILEANPELAQQYLEQRSRRKGHDYVLAV